MPFDSVETGKGAQEIDLTYLKTYLYNNNLMDSHPTLFKRVNDICKTTNFEAKLSAKDFIKMFVNEEFLLQDISDPRKNQSPSLEQIAEMFEFLDVDHTGMIEAKEVVELLNQSERLKVAGFDLKTFNTLKD